MVGQQVVLPYDVTCQAFERAWREHFPNGDYVVSVEYTGGKIQFLLLSPDAFRGVLNKNEATH